MIDDRPYDTGATTLLCGGWAADWDGQPHRIVERGEVAMRDDRFAPSPRILPAAPLTAGTKPDAGGEQLSAEFSLVQMLRCGATTIVDAGGSGPILWLGNPPTDEDSPGRDRRPHRLPGLSSLAHR